MSDLADRKSMEKYKGGRVPPLVAGSESQTGLMDGEFLAVYQQGFAATNVVPIGIYLPADHPSGHPRRWLEGHYSVDRWSHRREKWIEFCVEFRKTKVDGRHPGDEACKGCEARHAAQAEQERRAIAYFCDAGLIDFATPVIVGDEVVAVLMSGQRKPKGGVMWPQSALQKDGLIEPPEPGEVLVDAWAESQKRIANCEKEVGLLEGELLAGIERDVEKFGPDFDIGPDEVKLLKARLQQAGDHLSLYANQTYELERGAAIGNVRAKIAAALVAVTRPTDQELKFKEHVKEVLRDIHNLTSCTAVAAVYCGEPGIPERDDPDASLRSLLLVAQAGLSDSELPIHRYDCRGKEQIVRQALAQADEAGAPDVDVKPFQRLPVFGEFADKGCTRVVLVPMRIPGITKGFLLAGWETPVPDLDRNGMRRDKRLLTDVGGDLALVVEVFYMLGQLKESSEAQGNFIEAFAHDLRSPIQNIMVAAENIEKSRIPAHAVSGVLSDIVKQLKRLDWISRRLWIMERIRLGELAYDDRHRVQPMEPLAACKSLLDGLAGEHSVEIVLDDSLTNCPPLRVDREMFQLCAINLLHNAIKYSSQGSEINVKADWDSGRAAFTFANRGIQIPEEDLPRVWDRGFRAEPARRKDPTGMGLGLALVRAFLDHYGGTGQAMCQSIAGMSDYLVRFFISIPR